MEVSSGIKAVSSDNGGLIGIGTLIVFIAMVIVASVTSGTLINTATALKGQARDTSSSTMNHVATGVRALTVNGRAEEVIIGPSAGSYTLMDNADRTPERYDLAVPTDDSGTWSDRFSELTENEDAGFEKAKDYFEREFADVGVVDNTETGDIIYDLIVPAGEEDFWAGMGENLTTDIPDEYKHISITTLDVFVKLRPGSPGVDLRDMTIQYQSSDGGSHPEMTENAYGSREDLFAAEDDDDILDETFGVVKIRNPSGTDNRLLSSESDMSEIWIDIFDMKEEDGLRSGESATLALIPGQGIKTYVKVRAPSTLPKPGVYKLRY